MKDLLELRRQFVHILLGSILLGLYYVDLIDAWFFGVLLLVLVVIIALSEAGNTYARHIILAHDRKHTLITGWGAFTFLTGFLITSVLFDKDVALAALAIMVFGDGVSTLVGYYHAKNKLPHNKQKTWEGSITGFLAASLAALFFVSIPAAILGALSGMFVESVKKPHVIFDDNILIPLVSGVIIALTNAFI